MKVGIVKASQLKEKECWSPLRFLDACDDCKKVERCKWPESSFGRIRVLKRKLIAQKLKVTELEARLRKDGACLEK